MPLDPANSAISRLRLACGDITDLPYLADDIYQYCLDTQLNNEPAATKMAAQLILAQLSYGSHQRLDKIEMWGSEAFNNYLTYIKQVITNPANAAMGGVYVGGMLLSDVQQNLQDTTLVQKRLINYPKDSYLDDDLSLYRVPDVDDEGYDYFRGY